MLHYNSFIFLCIRHAVCNRPTDQGFKNKEKMDVQEDTGMIFWLLKYCELHDQT
jgi:hypothetical protein